MQELSQWLENAPLRSRTHVWGGDTMIQYLGFLEKEIRHRRRSLGLTLKDTCMVVCDQASQHTTKRYEALRKAWCQQHNVTAQKVSCGNLLMNETRNTALHSI